MSISQPKATVVFVHGARYDPSCFDMVRAQLAQYSYPSTAVALPSTGSPTPSKQTHLEDVAKVRKTIEQLVLDEGKDVILVVFSYGGVPASGSVEGLDKAAIVKNEGKGGIIARVFISAFLPLKGESMLDASKDFASPSQQVEGDVLRVSDPKDRFYNDLSPPEDAQWIPRIRDQSKFSAVLKAISVPWDLTLSLLYLLCINDNAPPLHVQDAMINRIGKEKSAAARTDTGHFPILSRPGAVAEMIRKAAGETFESGQNSHLEWA